MKTCRVPSPMDFASNPMAFARIFWPDVRFYPKQEEIIHSIVENVETVVPAGNMLGKDFVAGFLTLFFFLTRHPCRVVTTSAKEKHLVVLWGEINQFIQTARYPLDMKKGGNLLVQSLSIRKIVRGELDSLSYIMGMVASNDSIASMQGHHIADIGDGIPRTFFLCDEASSVMNEIFTMARTWRNRSFIFGNPWDCNNLFYWAVMGNLATGDPGGDIPRADGNGFLRKVISIGATDSPNVQNGLEQKARGERPTNDILIPGVKSYERYLEDRKLLDKVEQCVSLDGLFYEGEEIRLFPQDWLDKAMEKADELARIYGTDRKGKTLGIDPAEGGDKTVWTVGDALGFIFQRSERTADTSVITDVTLGIMRDYGISPENVIFDRGGGGKEHADRMRKNGYNVRTVAFGEKVVPERKRGLTPLEQKKLQDEERYAYFNRRSEMYGLLSRAINPESEGKLESEATSRRAKLKEVYGIPKSMVELHKQLRPIPKIYDKEGQLWLPPKNKPPGSDKSTVKTLIELIGHSPDEADSAVLCYYGLIHKGRRIKAGAV